VTEIANLYKCSASWREDGYYNTKTPKLFHNVIFKKPVFTQQLPIPNCCLNQQLQRQLLCLLYSHDAA